MCLRVKDPTKIKTTSKERVFYKILAVCSDNTLVTPYIGVDTNLGGLNYTYQDGFDIVERRNWFEVSRGGYHLFKNKEDADREAKWMNTHFLYLKEYRVYKAVVPKNTQYVEGVFSVTGDPCVVVKAVRYEEI